MGGGTAEIPGLNKGTRRKNIDLRQYSGHIVSNPNGTHPNVLMGTGDFIVANTAIYAGALSAVGGQQTIRIKKRRPKRNHAPAPDDGFGAAGAYLNVLPGFGGTVPTATYGAASFSAVGGDQMFFPARGSDIPPSNPPTSRMDVPQNCHGRSFPRPIDRRFDDGQCSAVAHNKQGEDPSVLRDFHHFEVRNAKFLPGSFSAVGMDQLIVYNDDDSSGEKWGKNADELLTQDDMNVSSGSQ